MPENTYEVYQLDLVEPTRRISVASLTGSCTLGHLD